MKNGAVASLLLLVIILGSAAGYFAAVTTSHTTTVTSTTYASLPISHSKVFLMNVNGSLYYADDVSEDITVQNPGYSYFLNGSVTFSGVKFETICPPSYGGCPIPAGSGTTIQSITVTAGAFRFNMTFPDGSTETTGNIIGDMTYTFALSQHTNPRAGMLIEYVDYNYPSLPPYPAYSPYHAFLLVSS